MARKQGNARYRKEEKGCSAGNRSQGRADVGFGDARKFACGTGGGAALVPFKLPQTIPSHAIMDAIRVPKVSVI